MNIRKTVAKEAFKDPFKFNTLTALPYSTDMYNFEINDTFEENNIGILLTSTYNFDRQYESSFLLDPFAARELGELLVKRANHLIDTNTCMLNLISNRYRLETYLKKDLIDSIHVKLIQKNAMKSNMFIRKFNIYPIFKDSKFQNMHFNFDILLDVSNINTTHDEFFRNILNLEDNNIKIKFIKCNKVFEEDKKSMQEFKEKMANRVLDTIDKEKFSLPKSVDIKEEFKEFLNRLQSDLNL